MLSEAKPDPISRISIGIANNLRGDAQAPAIVVAIAITTVEIRPRMTIIIFAIISGIAVFGQIPDQHTLAGILIVCSAGLYTFYREQTLRRQAKA